MHIHAEHIKALFAAVLLTALGFVIVDFLIIPVTFWQYFFIELVIIGLSKIIEHTRKELNI